MTNKQAPEIIGFVMGCDINDVKEGRYQRTSNPAVYVLGSYYYCCPTEKQKLPEPETYGWEPVETAYGRTVYCGKAGQK